MKTKFSDQIRNAVKASGMTRYAISKATGVDASALHKFVHGERGLSLDAIDAIAEVLGLSVATEQPKRKQRKG